MVWEPENEALLKSLRLRAGMDIATLARRNIVSTAQVRQLEDGGNSSFYSPEIKYAVGKKLLQSLGHDLKIEVPLTVQAIVENDPSQSARCSNTVEIPLQDSTINLPNKHLFKTSSVVFLLLASCVLASTAALFWFNKSKTEPVQVTLHGPIEVKAEFQAQVKDTTELERQKFHSLRRKRHAYGTTQKKMCNLTHLKKLLSMCIWWHNRTPRFASWTDKNKWSP